MIPPSNIPRPVRDGVVLVAVIIVIAAMSLSAYSFARWMRAEARAAEIQLRTVQARLSAESAVELTRALLMGRQQGFPTPDLRDSPRLFRNVALFEPDEDVHPRMRGRFTVMAPVDIELGPAQLSGIRYGTSDENAKIDLNAWALRDPAALKQILQTHARLPEQLAYDVVDWIAPARWPSTGRPFESQPLTFPHDPQTRSPTRSLTHSATDAYRPKHAPLATLDELLLVRGMTRELLYGWDNAEAIERPAPATPQRFVPLARFATLYARDGQTDRRGRPRIRLNQPDLASLFRQVRAEFGEPLARFVIALRILGASPAVASAPTAEQPADTSVPRSGQPTSGRFVISSVLDLLVPKVTGVWNGRSVTVQNPVFEQGEGNLQAAEASTVSMNLDSPTGLLDRVTVSEADVRHGVVNVNTASPEALAILPGLSEEDRSRVLAARGNTQSRHGTAWLVTESVVSPETFRAIEPFVTGWGDVVRVHAVGSVGDQGPLVTLEAVIDAARNPPELRHYKIAGPPSGRFRDALPLAEQPQTLPSDYGLPRTGTPGPMAPAASRDPWQSPGAAQSPLTGGTR